MTDRPGSASTLVLVVVKGTEGDRGELLYPEEDKLAELGHGVDVTEADNDCGDKDDGDGAPEWVDKKGEGNKKEDEDKVESEGATEALAATRRMRMAEDSMDVQ
jgi:hypothetical protein